MIRDIASFKFQWAKMEGPVDTAFWRGHDQWENGKFAKKNNGLHLHI